MKHFLRAFIFIVFYYQLNMLFVLFPYRNKALDVQFKEILTVVEKHCDKPQYYLPSNITIKFDALQGEEIAYCQRKVAGFELAFDRYFWTSVLDPVDRKQVMMHEMTHCLFNQDHVSDPNHYMAPYFKHFSEEELNRQFLQYLQVKCGK